MGTSFSCGSRLCDLYYVTLLEVQLTWYSRQVVSNCFDMRGHLSVKINNNENQ